jgi:uncharacterized protein YdaU (DUF1376 family)
MAQPAPAFSFYAKDFLLGTVTMSLAERGAYITLLAFQWDNGSVPNDSIGRARVLSCPSKQADALWSRLRVKFEQGADGHWRNRRLEMEREKQAERRAALVANGAKGGRPPKNQKVSRSDNQTETNRLSGENQGKSLPFPFPGSAQRAAQNARAGGPLHGESLLAGSRPVDHGECLAHGPVCMRTPQVRKYLPRFGGDVDALRAWAQRVCDRWQVRVDAGERPPYGDDFAFWAAEYDAEFGNGSGRKAVSTVPDVDETAQYLATIRSYRR